MYKTHTHIQLNLQIANKQHKKTKHHIVESAKRANRKTVFVRTEMDVILPKREEIQSFSSILEGRADEYVFDIPIYFVFFIRCSLFNTQLHGLRFFYSPIN